MCFRTLTAALGFLLIATTAHASVVLRIESDEVVGALESPFTVDAQQVRGNGFGPPVPFQCSTSGECALDLPKGAWVLSSGDERVYALPVSTSILDDAKSPVVPFRIHRAAKISGRIKEPETVDRLSMVFQGEGEGALSGRAQCKVTESRFDCIVPEGQWDLRLSVARYVPHYLWKIEVHADKARNLGELTFERGASLSGRVEIERGVTLNNPGDIRVSLVPAAAFRTADDQRRASRSVQPNEKGFFQFGGVAAGEYTLLARTDGAAAEPQVLRVIADAEAELRKPLLVAKLRSITANLVPLWDDAGNPWRVQLRKRTPDGRLSPVTESAADVQGLWRHDRAWPGRYELSVMDAAGSTWLWKEIEVDKDIDLLLHVQRTRLTGELRMGGRPIAATLGFHSPTGAQIKVIAGEDGKFSGHLTAERDAAWTVKVQSAALSVERELRSVRPEYSPDGDAHVSLTLPEGHLSGKVVFEDGNAVRGGWVKVTSHDGTETLIEAPIARDGAFALNGLPAGKYLLQGHSSRDKQPMASEVVAASVAEEEADSITLTVRPDRMTRGVVLSQGQPVIGASVTLMPTDREWLLAAAPRTDANGRFAALLPHGTQEVDVVVKAPGFATRVFHARLPQDDLVIRLAQSGGQLHLSAPVWNSEDPRVPQPWIVHDGAVVHARALAWEQWGEKTVTFESGPLDPGVYALCRATYEQLPQIRSGDLRGAQCVSRMVPPFARVELELPK